MKIEINQDLKLKPVDALAIVHHSLHQGKSKVFHLERCYKVSSVKQNYTIKRGDK